MFAERVRNDAIALPQPGQLVVTNMSGHAAREVMDVLTELGCGVSCVGWADPGTELNCAIEGRKHIVLLRTPIDKFLCEEVVVPMGQKLYPGFGVMVGVMNEA